MLSAMSRDSGMSMNSLQTGYSGDTGSLPSLMGAHNDWEIAPMDIEILRREDGSPWELGAGAFGKVRIHRSLHPSACALSGPTDVCWEVKPQHIVAKPCCEGHIAQTRSNK